MYCAHTCRSLLFVCLVLAFSISAPTGASGQQYVFNRATFPTGNTPSGIVVADVNGDGRQDIIVTNRNDNSISVLLGQTDGSFGPKTDFPTGFAPYMLVAGDFNGDGKVDVAMTNVCGQNCGSVSVLLGNGDGTFQPHVEYQTGQSPFWLVLADFNGDGKLDLAAGGFCSQTCSEISVLLGKGDGTFQPKVDYPVGTGISTFVTADINRDSKLDLVVASPPNNIAVLLGNGDGTFKPATNFPSPNSADGIAIADFDGEKILDLVVTHTGAGWPVTFLKGNGDGTFQPEQQITITSVTIVDTSFLQALDLNGDGKPDLVLTDVSEGSVLVFFGNGNGTFQQPVLYAAGVYPFVFAVQDVNGDGNLDFAVVDQQNNLITVLLGNGDATFSPRVPLHTDPCGINLPCPSVAAVADLNADGLNDVVILNSASVAHVLLGKEKGQFQPPLDTNTGGGGANISIADFNGDGHPDMALATGNGAAMVPGLGAEILLGKGDGTFGTPTQVVTTLSTPRSVLIGDFNNDGKADLVVLGNGFDEPMPIYVALGNGDGTFQPSKHFGTPSLPSHVAVGDFNRDGKTDLVVCFNPTGIGVLISNGDGTFQTPVTYPTDDLPSYVTVADLNGDGIPDIVAVAGKVDVYLGKGDGTFANPVFYNGGNFPQLAVAGDFNADGKIDLAVAAEGNTTAGGLEILLGNGDGTFQPPVEIGDGSSLTASLAVGDLNQDGTPDIVTAGGGVASLFLSSPVATLGPAMLNFGSVTVGTTSSPQTATLHNNGNAPLDLASVAASTNYSVADSCGTSLAPRASCALNVTFAPSSAGPTTGLLTTTDNVPSGKQVVALNGSGQAITTPPDFSLSIPANSSNSATVTAGAVAKYAVVLAPVAGFHQSVSFSCSGAPTASTCTISPASSTPDGTKPVNLTVQVTTTARAIITSLPTFQIPVPGPSFLFVFVAALLSAALFGKLRLWFFALPRRRQCLAYFLTTLLLGIVAAGTSGCGGGGSSGSPPGGGTVTGTPAGSYTLTVTAASGTGTAAIQHTIQLTVTVN